MYKAPYHGDFLQSWARKSGHGTFFLSVTDGIPNFHFGLQLDFCDAGPTPEPRLPPAGQDHQQRDAPQQKHTQGKKARNQVRAANFHAAKAAAAVAPTAAASATPSTISFPEHGKFVGTAPNPVLPLPLKKGDVFPPSTTSTTFTSSTSTAETTSASVVRSSHPSSTSSTLAMSPSSHPVLPPVKVRDAVLSEESDDENDDAEYYYNCGQCDDDIDSKSPSYYCPLCVKCFHIQCITGHKCIKLV